MSDDAKSPSDLPDYDIADIARRSLVLPEPGAETPSFAAERLAADVTCYHRADVDVSGRPELSCAIGAFDGVHVGHRALVDDARSGAAAMGCLSGVVLFDPDPAEVLVGPQPSSQLLSITDRIRALEDCGVDMVVTLSFTKELAGRSPEDFVRHYLVDLLNVKAVCVGSNFRFGYRGQGDGDALRELGERLGFSVKVHQLVSAEGASVSATRIRKMLHDGDAEDAAKLLGRCHYIRGKVEHGRGEGTSFGFPTANVESDLATCMPSEGVYACAFVYGDGVWPAAVNVGAPPTFSSPRPAFLEANLIGYKGDLYGDDVAVIFIKWLRASRPFSSEEELERVVLSNIAWVRMHLGATGRRLA